jgi:hypothetical protein
MLARRFLYGIAALIVLCILGFVGFKAFEPQLVRLALVPNQAFAASPVDPAPDFRQPAAWIAHPALGQDPSRMAPVGYQAAPRPVVDVFFITPTTYLARQHWNAPLSDGEANRRLRQSARHQASVFNGVGQIWIPHYRQAAFGAFLVNNADSLQALTLAYSDVEAAFGAFIATRPAARPFILAGHSQGARHLLRLLKARITGTPLKEQLVAAYVVGWPVAIPNDLDALPDIPVCQTPQATGCLISWQSFGVGANTTAIAQAFQEFTGLNGQSNATARMVCVNPLSGWADDKPVPAERNIGALAYAAAEAPLGATIPNLVGGACKADGFFHLSASPGEPFRALLLPGENYHTYDYNLVWANVRANAEQRVAAFLSPTLNR